MEIAVVGSAPLYDRFLAALREQGFHEPVGRFDQLGDPERARLRFLFGWGITQAVVDACPGLEWIQGAGAGVDWLLPVRLAPGVVVTRVIDQFGPDMAEYVLLALLAWVKDWRRLAHQQQEQVWQQFLVDQLARKTVGVLGAGSIGGYIAAMLVPVVAEVRVMGRSRPSLAGARNFSQDAWPEFYGQLDALVIVVPHTPHTRHLVGAPELSLMRDGSYVVNVARGAVLDTKALVEQIGSGHLSGATLDVFEEEPLPTDSPLWTTPGITVTPHIAGPSRPEGMARVFIENLNRLRRGQPLLGVVDWERGY